MGGLVIGFNLIRWQMLAFKDNYKDCFSARSIFLLPRYQILQVTCSAALCNKVMLHRENSCNAHLSMLVRMLNAVSAAVMQVADLYVTFQFLSDSSDISGQ